MLGRAIQILKKNEPVMMTAADIYGAGQFSDPTSLYAALGSSVRILNGPIRREKPEGSPYVYGLVDGIDLAKYLKDDGKPLPAIHTTESFKSLAEERAHHDLMARNERIIAENERLLHGSVGVNLAEAISPGSTVSQPLRTQPPPVTAPPKSAKQLTIKSSSDVDSALESLRGMREIFMQKVRACDRAISAIEEIVK